MFACIFNESFKIHTWRKCFKIYTARDRLHCEEHISKAQRDFRVTMKIHRHVKFLSFMKNLNDKTTA